MAVITRTHISSDFLRGACLAVVDLLPPLAALVTPREVRYRNEEERVAWVSDTGEGVIPGQERGEEGEDTSGFDAAAVGRAAGVLKVADAKKEEGHVQHEEQKEESNGRAQSAEQQEELFQWISS